MNLDALTVGEVVQHAVVTAVAIGALAVVLRKVLGVFDKGQATGTPASAGPTPMCSHCTTRPSSVGRDGSPSRPK